MDTSEEYVRMCDCPEIQEHAEESGNDYYMCRNGDEWN